MTDSTPKDQADQMINNLRRGKSIYDIFADQVKTRIVIQGKTMEQWKEYFNMDIPESPSTEDCKVMDMQLMHMHQEAAFLKTMSEASLMLGKKSYDTDYRKKFTSLVQEYKADKKKLPAKDTLETLAKAELDDIESGLAYAELGVRLWKDMLSDLDYKRKIIENATINNSVEAKFISAQR
jgi:hypothetical protein